MLSSFPYSEEWLATMSVAKFGKSSGLWIGGFSGLFASVAMLGLMFTYFYRNPEFGSATTTTSEDD